MPKKAVNPKTGLLPLEERFIAEYGRDNNATQAYLRAKGGTCTAKTAATEGSRLLGKPEIKAIVAAKEQRRLVRVELTAENLLEELRRIAFFDPADFFDAHGKLLPIRQMTREARAVIAGLEVARANLDPTDGKRSPEWLHKIKLASKVDAITLGMKKFKLLTEVIEVQDWDKHAARLASARQRDAKRKPSKG